jgi:hypothetical protein
MEDTYSKNYQKYLKHINLPKKSSAVREFFKSPILKGRKYVVRYHWLGGMPAHALSI